MSSPQWRRTSPSPNPTQLGNRYRPPTVNRECWTFDEGNFGKELEIYNIRCVSQHAYLRCNVEYRRCYSTVVAAGLLHQISARCYVMEYIRTLAIVVLTRLASAMCQRVLIVRSGTESMCGAHTVGPNSGAGDLVHLPKPTVSLLHSRLDV
jgi:hypothetical protein